MANRTTPVLEILQKHVGGCREELGADGNYDKCWKPAEYVIWGKLSPNDSLGPRCWEHARKYLSGHALAPRSQYALINLKDLTEDLEAPANE